MNIEEIRDILRVVKRYKSSEEEFFSFKKLSNDESTLGKFYEILLNEQITSDEEAAQLLYGSKKSINKYQVLKSTFTSRLINSITFLDLNNIGLSEHTQNIYKAYKYLLVISVLLALGRRANAIRFAKKILKIADKYELHIVAIDLLEKIRTHTLQLGKEKEYIRYEHLLRKRIRLYEYETEIRAKEQRINIRFTKSLFVDEKLKSEALVALEETKTMLLKADTYWGRISYYKLLYICQQIQGSPSKSIVACDEALKYLSSIPHMSPPSRYAEFGLYKLENYILAKDYSNGKLTVQFCEEHMNRGMNLWFTVKEYEFLLMMQTLNFDQAIGIYEEVVSHERFRSQLSHLKEKWDIFGLYVTYLIRVGFTNPENVSRKKNVKSTHLLKNKNSREKKFHSPTFAKDKRGFNIAILIMNVLILLEGNKRNLLIEQLEALSSYRFKYLNQKRCYQSFILFKLIRLMIRNDFDIEKINQKSSEIEKSFYDTNANSGEVFECIQILPPYWVWNRMKEVLSEKNTKVIK